MNSPDPFAGFGLRTEDGTLSQRGVRYRFKRVMKHLFERTYGATASRGPRIPMWKNLFDFEGKNVYAILTSVARPRIESQMLLTPWSTLNRSNKCNNTVEKTWWDLARATEGAITSRRKEYSRRIFDWFCSGQRT